MNSGANFLCWLSATAGPELAATVQAKFGGVVLMIPGGVTEPAPALGQRLQRVAADADQHLIGRFIKRRDGRAVKAVCQVELDYGGVPFVMHCAAAQIAEVDHFEVGGFSLARPGSLILFWKDKTGQLCKGLADPVGSVQ